MPVQQLCTPTVLADRDGLHLRRHDAAVRLALQASSFVAQLGDPFFVLTTVLAPVING